MRSVRRRSSFSTVPIGSAPSEPAAAFCFLPQTGLSTVRRTLIRSITSATPCSILSSSLDGFGCRATQLGVQFLLLQNE